MRQPHRGSGHPASATDQSTALDPYADVRRRVRACALDFPRVHPRDLDGRRAYPEELVVAMTRVGSSLGVDSRVSTAGADCRSPRRRWILEEVNRSGGNAGPVHARNVPVMGTILHHASEGLEVTAVASS